jgi:probable rRNA maturation factor
MREANLIGEVRVKLVNDAEMIEAHARHCGDPTTTDVLTFDLSDGGGSRTLDVDLMLCADEARRQAGVRGHAIEQELLLYALHGMLHCVGYDDHDDAGYAAMHAEEDRILEAIGVGRTFASFENGGATP